MDIDIPLPRNFVWGPNDHPILVWAYRRLDELGQLTGQLRVPESIARPLITEGLVQEWSATDGDDLKDIDLTIPPPIVPAPEPPPSPSPSPEPAPAPEGEPGLLSALKTTATRVRRAVK